MTTAPTPQPEALADQLEDMTCLWSPSNNRDFVNNAAIELRRLQAENERLLTQIHKLEMDALNLASENSILKRAETDELEARKPLPLSIERLDELWASQRSFHGGEPLKMGHVEFARLIEVEYGVLGRIPIREENGGQIDPTLVDKSPNLQEPLVDKTANLQDRGTRKPLPPDALADKCEAWLQAGGAANIVDAFEAGYRAAEET